MPGFRGPNPYAGTAGADLENAPAGPVPFTSPIGLPVTRMVTWHAGGVNAGAQGGVPGTVIHRAYGNPSVATVETTREKSPYGGVRTGAFRQDREGAAQTRGGLPQFGVPRVLQQSQESSAAVNAVGGANDKLITYDRHAMMKVGNERSGRNSGFTDPPLDGPARPSLWLVQRTVNYQQGTDTTANQDDLNRDYTRNAEGMYVGTQGQGWSTVYGGVPGLYQEYGSYAGYSPDTPDGTGIHAPVPQGQPGDGPRNVWGGPPHGLHSPTLPVYNQTLGRYLSIPQMALPRQDRPDNSRIAGQSYSQTVQPQSQTGTVAQNIRLNSGVNFNQRLRGNGWRGRATG